MTQTLWRSVVNNGGSLFDSIAPYDLAMYNDTVQADGSEYGSFPPAGRKRSLDGDPLHG